MEQVAVRVDALGAELDQIKTSLDGKSKGRHDSIKVKVRQMSQRKSLPPSA
jgi:hypothetical protein